MKRKPIQLANTRFSAKQHKPSRLGRFWLVVVRVLMWLLLSAFVCFVIGASFWLLKQELFNRNLHFTLRQLDIQVHGVTAPREIEQRLIEAGIRRGHTNLFNINLADLRHRIDQWSTVPSKQILLRKRLPDTLEVTIFERDPVAQLRSGSGPLIDVEGVVIPGRDRGRGRTLPLITPIRESALSGYGEVVNDEGVRVALQLLVLVDHNPDYSRLLDIDLIQLHFPGADRMLLYLKHQGPFVAGAQIVMPMHRDALPMALARVEAIALNRLQEEKITGYIDATIRQNTPVLGYPRY